MKLRKSKKPAHGGARPGAGRPRSAEAKTVLRLSIAHEDAMTIARHPDGYRQAKDAVAVVADRLRKPTD